MPRRKRIAPSISRIRSAITNGSSVLANVDHRSAMMRRLKDLISAHESDLGGEDYVSESERRIVRRAAMLTIQLEMLDAKFAANEGEATWRNCTCTRPPVIACAACCKPWAYSVVRRTSRHRRSISTCAANAWRRRND